MDNTFNQLQVHVITVTFPIVKLVYHINHAYSVYQDIIYGMLLKLVLIQIINLKQY
jgi:hypothetical protein